MVSRRKVLKLYSRSKFLSYTFTFRQSLVFAWWFERQIELSEARLEKWTQERYGGL